MTSDAPLSAQEAARGFYGINGRSSRSARDLANALQTAFQHGARWQRKADEQELTALRARLCPHRLSACVDCLDIKAHPEKYQQPCSAACAQGDGHVCGILEGDGQG